MHVYGQTESHDEVSIIGDRKAIHALINALNQSLSSGLGDGDVFAADGEGYRIFCAVVEPHEAQKLSLPYTDYPEMGQGQFPLTPNEVLNRSSKLLDKKEVG